MYQKWSSGFKITQELHLRFQRNSIFLINDIPDIIHQRADIPGSCTACIDHKATVFLRNLCTTT